tara:strand:- start:13388 stop:13843 length:456 start_codon:yes stop_codon:yes gene_type:complete
MSSRTYTSRRANILAALTEKLKDIDGSGAFLTDLQNNVEPRLKFWDEVMQFPAVHLNAGTETREYQGGGFKNRFLIVTIRCYVQDEMDATEALNLLMEDIETVIEENARLQYSDPQNNTFNTQQITIISITTDEGVLEPLGVGEITIEVQY